MPKFSEIKNYKTMKKYILFILSLFFFANLKSQAAAPTAPPPVLFHSLGIMGLGAPELLIVLLVLFVLLAIPIMYLATLQNTLKLTSPLNRTIQPSNVWLYLIPIVGTFIHIGAILKITETLKKEFNARGLRYSDSDFGKGVGLTFSIINISLLCVSLFSLWQLYLDTSNSNQVYGDDVFENHSRNAGIAFFPSTLIILLNLVQLICWIAYWVKISNCKNILVQSNHPAFQNRNSIISSQNGDSYSEKQNVNALDELKKLGELFKSGVLTQEEFEKEKAKILNAKK